MGNTDRIKNVAARVAKYHAQGDQIVVVVSAMSGVTDGLIKLAKDNFSVILQGVARIRVLGYEGSDPFLSCKVTGLPEASLETVHWNEVGLAN